VLIRLLLQDEGVGIWSAFNVFEMSARK